MLEKYLEIINKKKEEKVKVKIFLASIDLPDIDFDIEGEEVVFNMTSGERFFLNIKSKELKDFLTVNKLKVK
jgi:hypothetical protein